MGRYYFDVVHDGELAEDYEGSDLPNMDAVREEAIEGAREILASCIRHGSPIGDRTMRVRDESGQTVFSIPFVDLTR